MGGLEPLSFPGHGVGEPEDPPRERERLFVNRRGRPCDWGLLVGRTDLSWAPAP